MTSADFVPRTARRRGLHLRLYRVAEDGRRHSYSRPVEAIPEPGPPSTELHLDFWPDCSCPLHRAD